MVKQKLWVKLEDLRSNLVKEKNIMERKRRPKIEIYLCIINIKSLKNAACKYNTLHNIKRPSLSSVGRDIA